MRPAARLQAAIDILSDSSEHHRPAATALTDWGRRHRFAGSGDRSAIGTLVYDALRTRASAAALMGSDTPRALALGGLKAQGIGLSDIAALCDGGPHAPALLSPEEVAALSREVPDGAPAWVRGNYPEWLHASLTRAFGDRVVEETRAMARRAPIDVRVNTLKASREDVLKALAPFGAAPTHYSPVGVRVPPPGHAARQPHLESEASHGRGWFEVQDEGSQIVALLSGAQPGMEVLDLCAGAGGKTLALAAQMKGEGRIVAYDADKKQLRPIFERLARSGATNVEVLDGGDDKALEAQGATFDLVVVDAPCSGSGTWRRRPDAKWRLKPAHLSDRIGEQRAALKRASTLVKPGGRLAYITCSVLPEENGDEVDRFLDSHSGWSVIPTSRLWAATMGTPPPPSADGSSDHLLLTPADHGTDGFFIAVLARVA